VHGRETVRDRNRGATGCSQTYSHRAVRVRARSDCRRELIPCAAQGVHTCKPEGSLLRPTHAADVHASRRQDPLPNCGAKLHRPDLSLCAYCAMPLDIASGPPKVDDETIARPQAHARARQLPGGDGVRAARSARREESDAAPRGGIGRARDGGCSRDCGGSFRSSRTRRRSRRERSRWCSSASAP